MNKITYTIKGKTFLIKEVADIQTVINELPNAGYYISTVSDVIDNSKVSMSDTNDFGMLMIHRGITLREYLEENGIDYSSLTDVIESTNVSE